MTSLRQASLVTVCIKPGRGRPRRGRCHISCSAAERMYAGASPGRPMRLLNRSVAVYCSLRCMTCPTYTTQSAWLALHAWRGCIQQLHIQQAQLAPAARLKFQKCAFLGLPVVDKLQFFQTERSQMHADLLQVSEGLHFEKRERTSFAQKASLATVVSL